MVQYLSFCEQLISLHIMSSRFILVIEYDKISFFFKAIKKYSIAHITPLYPFICQKTFVSNLGYCE